MLSCSIAGGSRAVMASASLVTQVEAGPRAAELCDDGRARVGCC